MGKIRTLLVGCGKMGRNHLRVMRENPRFEVVGIVDPSPVVREMCADLDIPWRRQIPAEGYHAAVVATRAAQHSQIVANLLARGTPTLVEKPLSDTHADCVVGAKLVVGHIERFNPAVSALRSLLAAHELGPVLRVDTRRVGSPPPFDPGAPSPRPDIVADLAVHDIDLCRWLFGPLRVESAVCERTLVEHGRVLDQCATISLLSQTKINIDIEVDWTSPIKSRTMVVVGLTGTITIDFQKQTLDARGVDRPIVKAEPLALELDAFATFVETGECVPELCVSKDAAAAVLLCDHARTQRGFV